MPAQDASGPVSPEPEKLPEALSPVAETAPKAQPKIRRPRKTQATPASGSLDQSAAADSASELPAETPAVQAGTKPGEGKSSAKSGEREIELKFMVNGAGLSQALASPLLHPQAPEPPSRSLISTYFDTPNWDLRKQRIVLRIRRNGRKTPLMAIKWTPEESEGPFSRGEIEIALEGAKPDIDNPNLDLFEAPVAEKLRRFIADQPLQPKFETRIKRRTRLLHYGGAQIEAAFDEGSVVAGDISLPLSEIELELKSGSASDLYEFGAQLTAALPLCLDPSSKAERGFFLAMGKKPTPVKMGAARLTPDTMLDDAVSRVALGALDHFLVNWPALRASDRPEAVHQMRVALRRLRAVLAMFNRTLPCAEFGLLRQQAKDIASAFGPARSCDVMLDMIDEGPRSHFSGRLNFEPLLEALEARRLTAYTDARALLQAPQTSAFVMRLNSFVARRGWRNALSGAELAALTAPAGVFAAAALERLHKKALKQGKDLLNLPDEQRHEVRIALKNLRYGAEFFSGCFADERGIANFVRATAELQDLLGAHNDAAGAEEFLKPMLDGEAAQAAGVVIGWYARGAVVSDAGLGKAWKAFKQSKPFWR